MTNIERCDNTSTVARPKAAADPLTRKQRRLLRELYEIADLTSVDFYRIKDYPREGRTTRLELMRNQLIRGYVITRYTLIDEFLGSEVCDYFFPGKKLAFIRQWRTERFRRFNHYILEELSLLQKLRLVRSFRDIPSHIAGDVERINALRNGLAHAFFPENLRKSPPIYKGKPIFSLAGLQLFDEDSRRVTEYISSTFWGIKTWDDWKIWIESTRRRPSKKQRALTAAG
jgi:hypothetical protein